MRFSWAPLEEPARRRKEVKSGKKHKRTASLPDLAADSMMNTIGTIGIREPGKRVSIKSDEGDSASPLSLTLSPKDFVNEEGKKPPSTPSLSSGNSARDEVPIEDSTPKKTWSDFLSDGLVDVSVTPTNKGKSNRRRNSLCDKLLESRLPDEGGQKVLLGGSRSSPNHNRNSVSAGRPQLWDELSLRQRAEALWSVQSKGSGICVGRQLQETFFMMDVPFPFEEVLNPILQRQCRGRSNLDREDFLDVVGSYEEAVEATLHARFKERSQADGSVPVRRLPDLLKAVGVPTMPGASGEILDDFEAIEKHQVNFEEFQRIYQDLVSRAGLVLAEHSRLSDHFEACEDAAGNISYDDFVSALFWNDCLLGLASSPGIVEKVAQVAVQRVEEGTISLGFDSWNKALDKLKPRSLNRVRLPGNAFLAAARFLHERISCGLKSMAYKMKSCAKTFDVPEIVSIIEQVGYIGATEASVEHFIRSMKIEDKKTITFDQLYLLIFKYCNAEGFTETETTDLTDIFVRFDEDGSKTLEVPELGPVIRWLGYQPTQYRIYSFAEDFGLEDDSQLDLIQFRKMVGQYLRQSLKQVRKLYEKTAEEIQGPICVSELGDFLRMVGYGPTDAEIDDMIAKAGGPCVPMRFHDFKKMEIAHRKHVRKTMEQNGGVTNSEFERYRQYFDDHASQGSISQKAMRNLLGQLFPATSLDRDRHVRIAHLVKTADADGNGLFDFDEFLWLMQRVTEDMDRDSLLKGLALKKKLGYSASEVKQFKDLYELCDDDMSGTIDSNELCTLFSNLILIDAQAKRELDARFEESNPSGSNELDFWEFLTFMRQVQKDNWRNINGVVGSVKSD